MNPILSLAVGGVSGTLARYGLSVLISRSFGDKFPYATMVINLIGCFILGFSADIGEEKLGLHPDTQLLLTVGFCGAFTTFSTFILETSHLIKDGHSWLAFANVLGSVTAGFMAFRLGVLLGHKV